MRKNNQYYIRKTHRWLGVIIGIQFLFWTISGLYFSWTDIDEIHGDHFIEEKVKAVDIAHIQLDSSLKVHDIGLRVIDQRAYFWINDSLLLDAVTGLPKNGVDEAEAIRIAQSYLKEDYKILSSTLITDVDGHDEYREKPLPAWAIEFESDDVLIAYVSQRDGSFQRVRYTSWRWFDFLWMFHTMDYEGRDNFNNFLLRAFSLFGLFTVASGFTLFFVTSKWRRSK